MENDEITDPIIEFRGVYKSFGDEPVLKGVNLKIERGKTTVVLGESGSGKSVLLKHMVMLLRPERGRIFFEGQMLNRLPERKLAPVRTNFGFLFQSGALFDSMTAGENVAFPLMEHTNYDKDKIEQIVHEKLRMVGLEDFASRMPGQLSGGQKKRIALARAIVMEPKVILYDEPTTGLDPIRADVINELILKLQQQLKVTSIVVTHDMKSAFKVGDRLLMLYDGNFIFDGTSEQMQQSEDKRVQRFIAGQASPDELEELNGA
jgi:phospholipid/cholesterol/gamma-HCH transport system ATP-binding protein